LSPVCWAAAFSAALPCRRALRRGPLAGTGAVPGGGAGGGGGGGAVVATLGGLARGGHGRGRSFGLVSSSHRLQSWAMARQPSEPPNFAVIPFCLRALFNVLPMAIWGHPVGRVGHPAREDHARQSVHGHARDVPSPLEKSVVVVAANGV
jgi:hypothetical protein